MKHVRLAVAVANSMMGSPIMMNSSKDREQSPTRRSFIQTSVAAAAIGMTSVVTADEQNASGTETLSDPESWLTKPDDFDDVSRGKPIPHTLSEAERRDVGLTRDTWRLDVGSDSESPATIRRPLTADHAFTFRDLMQHAEQHSVRFPKLMTCLNIGCPLGNGIWEGVPLRDVIWKTQPVENLRRVFYYGFHNNDPKQMFRSSLSVGRVFEDPVGLPPVILCYKLNGQWLTPERGGPVRIVVPEAYGFKSIKWVTNVVLSNISGANDTYADNNNDVDSPLKTFCATLQAPTNVAAGHDFPIRGYAQVGVSGLARVQVWIHNRDEQLPDNDPYFTSAPWQDAVLLPPPKIFGGGLPGGSVPADTAGFDIDGRPTAWPLLISKVFWHWQQPALARGRYSLRCRTVDLNGTAQPMPRPFRKSGHAKIEHSRFDVT